MAPEDFGGAVQEKVRDLMLAEEGLSPLKVVYVGDPDVVPYVMYPFGIVALLSEAEAAGERGFTSETGPVTTWKYSGVVQIEVVQRDSDALVPDTDRRADVPSYVETRRLTQAARRALLRWAGKDGVIPDDDRVEFADYAEQATERSLFLEVSRIENGLAVQSRSDNVTNVGTFAFAVLSRREEF